MIVKIKLKAFGSPLTVPVLKVLINTAVKNMYTMTYGEVCRAIGVANDGLAIRGALFHIQRFCDTWHLPRINYLVVNKKTGRPGDWVASKLTESGWRSVVVASYVFDWSLLEFIDDPSVEGTDSVSSMTKEEAFVQELREKHVEKYNPSHQEIP